MPVTKIATMLRMPTPTLTARMRWAALLVLLLLCNGAQAFDERATRDRFLKACPQNVFGSLDDEQEALYCLCMWRHSVEMDTKAWDRSVASAVLMADTMTVPEDEDVPALKQKLKDKMADIMLDHVRATQKICLQGAMQRKLDARGDAKD